MAGGGSDLAELVDLSREMAYTLEDEEEVDVGWHLIVVIDDVVWRRSWLGAPTAVHRGYPSIVMRSPEGLFRIDRGWFSLRPPSLEQRLRALNMSYP